jgi:hypothetical protein
MPVKMRVATISVTGANMIAMSADLVGQLVVFAVKACDPLK